MKAASTTSTPSIQKRTWLATAPKPKNDPATTSLAAHAAATTTSGRQSHAEGRGSARGAARGLDISSSRRPNYYREFRFETIIKVK
jgi:hypothetical protein